MTNGLNEGRTTMDDGSDHPAVVILGAGLAGLSLARQLLLETDRTVLLLERKEEIPGPRQKVGESTVQLAGYYFGKVLDLEEHLLDHHYMKYNLRFYWRTPGRDGRSIEDYSQSYIRTFSNVPSYQVDRNRLEEELLARNLEAPRFALAAPVERIEVELGEGGGPHRVSFEHAGEERTVSCSWVVDTTGRVRLLAKRMGLARRNSIRHGAFFWWVRGRVDVDRLTDLPPRARRLRRERAALGHLPAWLATQHFTACGLWFWVIPLRGKTSLGLVFDHRVLDPGEVFSVEKATRWVCEHFPLFARDLPSREVVDAAGIRDFSHDCGQTLSPDRWAMAGEAGRFTDPLYSPGSDLIAIYNTLITDCIATRDATALAAKCRSYEALMRGVYDAYVPTYAPGYTALGDPEVFALKYVWELTVYFAAYVFPFINDLFTDRRFLPAFQRFFSRLGPWNRNLQEVLVAYYRWGQEQGRWAARGPQPVFFDFTELAPLARAEKTFYRVGVSVEEARRVLQEQIENLQELARFIAARVAAVVAGDPALCRRRAFVEALDPGSLTFDPAGWRELARVTGDRPDPYPWSFDLRVLDRFEVPAEGAAVAPAGPVEREEAYR
jgi:flavin-dependent dehydrogenase